MLKYIPKEIVKKAKEIDLLTFFMNYKPDELVKKGLDTYSLKSHDSVIISNGLWHRFSTNEGGKTALDYLMKVEKMSLQEAVISILNKHYIELVEVPKEKLQIEKKIDIPKKSATNNKVIDYLKKRGIDEKIINYCIENNLIYQEKYTDNVVFLGYDNDGNIKYAGCRSTNDKRIMRDAKGSSKEYSFRLLSNNKNSTTLHVFESSIDLLSYATLFKLKGYDYQNHNLLALAGIYQPQQNIEQSKVPIALKNYLKTNNKIQNIVLHLDNDIAGRNATKSLIIALNKYNVYDAPAPYGKDINDYLCFKLGLKKAREMDLYNTISQQNKGKSLVR